MKLISIELLERRMDLDLRRQGLRSFASWKQSDRFVAKGQKARAFDSRGVALFHRDQTVLLEGTSPYGREYDGGGDPDDSDDIEDYQFDGSPLSPP